MRTIKQIYKHMATHLLANVKNDIDAPYFKWVDFWTRQTDNQDQESLFDTPALFIDIIIPQSEQAGILNAAPYFEVTFYVAYRNFDDSYEGSNGLDRSLEYLEILSRLHEQVEGYSHAEAGSFRFVRSANYSIGNEMCVYGHTYATNVLDGSAGDVRRKTITEMWDGEIEITKRPHQNPERSPDPNWDLFKM